MPVRVLTKEPEKTRGNVAKMKSYRTIRTVVRGGDENVVDTGYGDEQSRGKIKGEGKRKVGWAPCGSHEGKKQKYRNMNPKPKAAQPIRKGSQKGDDCAKEGKIALGAKKKTKEERELEMKII